MSTPDVVEVVMFFAAVLCLDSLRIPLARGGSFSVAGALMAATVLLFGVPVAASIGLLSGVASALIGPRTRPLGEIAQLLLVRVLSILACGGVLLLTSGLSASIATIILGIAAYVSVQYLAERYLDTRAGQRLEMVAFTNDLPVLLAQISAGGLVVVTYEAMSFWSLIPVLAMLLLVRQSWQVLHRIRESYRTTIAVLVEAAEAEVPAKVGHAQRTALIAAAVGQRCRLSRGERERLEYAALLHDIDEMRFEANPDCDRRARAAADVLRDAAFLSDVLPILRVCDGSAEGNAAATTSNVTLALIVIASSVMDSAQHRESSRDGDEMLLRLVAERTPPSALRRVIAAVERTGHAWPLAN